MEESSRADLLVMKSKRETLLLSSYFSKRNDWAERDLSALTNGYTSLHFNGFWIQNLFIPRAQSFILHAIEPLLNLTSSEN